MPNLFSKSDSDSVMVVTNGNHDTTFYFNNPDLAPSWKRVKERRIEAYAHDGWKQVDGRWYKQSDQESYRIQGKLSYAFNPNMKLTLGANLSRDQYLDVQSDFNSWKYRLDQYRSRLDKGFQGNATWRHQIGKKTFYTVSTNHFETSAWVAPRDPDQEKLRGGTGGRTTGSTRTRMRTGT